MDDPSATATDVQIFPTFDGLHLVAIVVTRKEAIRIWAVATQTNPGLGVPAFVLDVFLGTDHLLIVRKSEWLARPGIQQTRPPVIDS